jgi:hypothetical protein
VVKVGLEDDDPPVFPAEPSWVRVLANTVELTTSRRLKAAGLRAPRPGSRRAARWWRAATFALAVVVVAVVVVWLTGGLTTTSPRTTPASAAGAVRPAVPVRAQIQAAAWISSQASGSATIGCYPALCPVLQDHGVAPSRLVFLSAKATSPLGASLLVTSRTAGGTLAARYAPALVASFGSGPDRVEVFAVEPGGTAAYRAALRTDLAARRSAGTQLLHDSRIRFTTTDAGRLRAGEVDTRLLATLTALASQYSFRVTSFGNAAPGAPLLFRGVTVTGIGPSLPTALAMVRAQDVPYVPAHAAISHTELSIEFSVPSPPGLLSPVLDAGSPAPASASTATPLKSELSPKR